MENDTGGLSALKKMERLTLMRRVRLLFHRLSISLTTFKLRFSTRTPLTSFYLCDHNIFLYSLSSCTLKAEKSEKESKN